MDDTNPVVGETADKRLAAPGLPLVIHAQFVRDLSFENPNAPSSILPNQKNPVMDIDINLDVRRVQHEKIEFFYEVDITLNVTSKRDDKIVFIAELVYGSVVSLNNVPENRHHPMLLVQVPHYMYPFARQILSDAVQNGGFPALLLNPVDFRAMYLKRFGTPQAPVTEEASDSEDTPVSVAM